MARMTVHDDSIVSALIVEQTVLNGIDKMKKVTPVTISVALKDSEEAKKFTFFRSWTPPYTALILATGSLALLNVARLVPDADLAVEDVPIGLPVLRH